MSPSTITKCAAALVTASLLFIFPGESAAVMCLCYFAIYACCIGLLRASGLGSRSAELTILVFCTLLAAGVTLNTWYYTTYSGGTPCAPVLNNEDALLSWARMQQLCSPGHDAHPDSTRTGYGTFLSIISGYTASSIGPLLCLSMLFTALSIVIVGIAAAALCPGSDQAGKHRMATTAMITLSAVSYYISSGTILIKDALCCLLMALALYAIFVEKRRVAVVAILAFVVATATLVRTNLLYFIGAAAICAVPVRGLRSLAVALPFALVMFCACYILAEQGYTDQQINFSDQQTNFDPHPRGIDTPRLRSYNTVAGDYVELTRLQRIASLPYTMAVQFLTPLPWAFRRDAIFGPAVSWAHFSLPWYALGAILLFFFSRMRAAPRGCSAAFAFGVLAWLATAYVTGGTVSRYCLPWLPFFIPAAAWFIDTGQWRSRAFRRWAITYSIMLVAGLCLVFYMISTCSPEGWES